MIRKYVCFIDVNNETGQVKIDGLEKCPLIDKINIATKLIYEYEKELKRYNDNV